MHKHINWFSAIHFNFVCILISSSVITMKVNFDKKSVLFSMTFKISFAFQSIQKVNLIFKMAAYICLMCQNFDIPIAITFLFFILF